MKTFEVSSKVSGMFLGTYDADDADAALDASAKDAGYADFRAACAITDPEDLDAEVEKCMAEMSVVEV